jgi:general stress protein YciG
VAGSDNLTPFTKDDNRASEAGKKGGKARPLKSMLNDILNEKAGSETIQKIKKRFNIKGNINNSEALIRQSLINAIDNGQIKDVVEIMKITGEYNEKIEVDQSVIFLDAEDKGV